MLDRRGCSAGYWSEGDVCRAECRACCHFAIDAWQRNLVLANLSLPLWTVYSDTVYTPDAFLPNRLLELEGLDWAYRR